MEAVRREERQQRVQATKTPLEVAFFDVPASAYVFLK